MNCKLLFRTIRYLKLKQIVYQIKNRISKENYVQLESSPHALPNLSAKPIARFRSLKGKEFTFLNLSHNFTDWNFIDNGTLFTYNQNYFDFINDDIIGSEEACRWIDRFIVEIPNITWGMDSYPIALRSINWIKFFSTHPEFITKRRDDSIWSQLILLQKKLEFHLLGNHLLEDSFALYIGGNYFQDKNLIEKGYSLLVEQLEEQTLLDGGHYEQSPMYHLILLDRLLDCINIRPTIELKKYAEKQLGWLESIRYSDGTFPMFNDSALSIAPSVSDVFDYAKRLNIEWKQIPLADSGYRRLENKDFEITIDVGDIKASYQPGHSHADTFNYELRVHGAPFVVDTGVSTYDKTSRRQYERSSIAHNVVVINNEDSSEVWGGFRVGRRAKVTLLEDLKDRVVATHDGYSKYGEVKRVFEIKEQEFVIEDFVRTKMEVVSYIHFAPNVIVDIVNGNLMTNILNINIDGANKIEIVENTISKEYNKFEPIKVAKIYFNSNLKLTFVKI